MARRRSGPTEKQRTVLEFIRDTVRRTGNAPTCRVIADHLGVDVRAAHQHLQKLREQGCLEPGTTGRRTKIRLADQYRPERGVPVLGAVPAGPPLEAEAQVERYLDLAAEVERGQLFSLRVRGDSMVDRGILDGDLLLVRATDTEPREGKVFVAALDGQFTVKTVRRSGDRVMLVAENQAAGYPPIPLAGDDVRLLGRAIWSLRELK